MEAARRTVDVVQPFATESGVVAGDETGEYY